MCAEEGRKIHGLAPRALELLKAYTWPGNVRQLENTIFRAIVLCESDVLEVVDFPQIATLVDGFDATVPDAPSLAPPPALPSGESAIIGADNSMSTVETVSDGSGIGISAVTDGGHIRRLEEIEKDMIRLALHRYRGQMSQVARKLGIGRSTLYRKMRSLGLEEAS